MEDELRQNPDLKKYFDEKNRNTFRSGIILGAIIGLTVSYFLFRKP